MGFGNQETSPDYGCRSAINDIMNDSGVNELFSINAGRKSGIVVSIPGSGIRLLG